MVLERQAGRTRRAEGSIPQVEGSVRQMVNPIGAVTFVQTYDLYGVITARGLPTRITVSLENLKELLTVTLS